MIRRRAHEDAQAAGGDDAQIAAAPSWPCPRWTNWPTAGSSLIPDTTADAKKVRRVICSGKVYYDLLDEARSRASRMSRWCASNSVPFPRDLLTAELSALEGQGSHLVPKSRRTRARGTRSSTTSNLPGRWPELYYAGRGRSPRPPRDTTDHVAEQQQLIADALVNRRPAGRRGITSYTRRTARSLAWPLKSKSPSCPNPSPTPPSPAGTRSRAMRSGATRTSSTRDRQGRAGSALDRRRRAEGNQVREGATVTSSQVIAVIEARPPSPEAAARPNRRRRAEVQPKAVRRRPMPRRPLHQAGPGFRCRRLPPPAHASPPSPASTRRRSGTGRRGAVTKEDCQLRQRQDRRRLRRRTPGRARADDPHPRASPSA